MNLRKIRKASLVIGGAMLGMVSLAPSAGAAVTDAAATQLLAKYGCQACRAVDQRLVGPGYKEIAGKYAGDTSAVAMLEQKNKNGSSGTWGAIPMPPNNVPAADLKTLVEWILAQK